PTSEDARKARRDGECMGSGSERKTREAGPLSSRARAGSAIEVCVRKRCVRPAGRWYNRPKDDTTRKGTIMAIPEHLRLLATRIKSAPVDAPPPAWTPLGHYAIGGLTDVGFGPRSEHLLVLSWHG